MTRTRPSAQLTKQQRRGLRDLNTSAQELAASGNAGLRKKIRDLAGRWPEEWLSRLNSEGIPPAGAPESAVPMWRLVIDALRDLARAGRISRDLEVEYLSRYLVRFDDVTRRLGGAPADALTSGREWLKAFVDLDPAPLTILRDCRRCRRWFWDMTDAGLQRYCPARCRKKASEIRIARRKSPVRNTAL